MEEWFFTHQAEMTPPIGASGGARRRQVTDFDAKYAATLELVKADIALGQQLEITSTPTFFINGVKVDGAWPPQFFDQAIAYELQHAEVAHRDRMHGAARTCTSSPRTTRSASGASARTGRSTA